MKRARKEKTVLQHINISDKNRKIRLVLIVLCLAVGVTLIAFSVTQCVTTEPGWTTIQSTDNYEDTCAGDFVFQYYLGDTELAPNKEQQQITQMYTKLTQEAFRLFHAEKVFAGLHNVAYLNAHPNEEVEVPEALYEALAMFDTYNNRSLFLAPVYQQYIGLFLSQEDWVAEKYDPTKNAEARAYFDLLLPFINDKEAVSLLLLGDNKIKLSVSEAYLQLATEKEITAFVDFYWLKNAFIADYIAQGLTEAGYTNGTFSSFDGYTRNLDKTERTYRINIFDRVEELVYSAATIEFQNVSATVSLHNYPKSALAVDRFYRWSDKTFTSCYIDAATGLSKTAINDLLAYSRNLSCGEIALRLFPVFVTDTWDASAVSALQAGGVETVYCKDREVFATENGAKFVSFFNDGEIVYKKH